MAFFYAYVKLMLPNGSIVPNGKHIIKKLIEVITTEYRSSLQKRYPFNFNN